MIRSEYLYRQCGEYVTSLSGKRFVKDYLRRVADQLPEKSIWVRTCDFEAREIATLNHCDHVIIDENPILGERGVRRGQQFPDAFLVELETLSELSEELPNLCLFFSYVPDLEALDFALEKAKQSGWRGKIGCMIETPSAALDTEAFIACGLDRIVIGLNDLTTLTIGSSRSSVHWSKTHSAVQRLLRIIYDCAARAQCEIRVAGNFNKVELGAIKSWDVGLPIVHYNELGVLFPDLDIGYGYSDTVARIKHQTHNLLKVI